MQMCLATNKISSVNFITRQNKPYTQPQTLKTSADVILRVLLWTKVNENWSSMITGFTITKGNAKVYALPTHVGIRHLRSQNYTTHS